MENVSDRGPLGRHHKKRTSTVNHKRERKIVIKLKSNQHVRKAHYGGFLSLNVNDVNVPKGNTAYK